ncbi:anti-anti-sigma factor [Micromonospora pallida]|uniref:Anti-sigma factor antagonist n=1 Tax=Micromonospora pallida TaxID=145854 RepID=A0A1C6RZQ3_9ACTN|nr:STAS domain-containing protein [Micromonospora pallida]SCL22645.1 anti-anti-sigma factor [Micromonospora pallida]
MTVVPGLRSGTVNLICDRCGDSVEAVPAVLAEPEVVWTVLVEQGWEGSPFAVGSHRCAGCVVASLVAAPPEVGGPVDAATGPGGWQVDVEELPEAVVLTPGGDIDALVVDVLREALAAALSGDRDVVLDLCRVGMLDSTGLGLLVRAHREARQQGRSFCLVAPSRFVLTVLHTMRLESVFLVFDHRAQALACLAAERPDLSTPGR